MVNDYVFIKIYIQVDREAVRQVDMSAGQQLCNPTVE